jgi:hypothetical protein
MKMTGADCPTDLRKSPRCERLQIFQRQLQSCFTLFDVNKTREQTTTAYRQTTKLRKPLITAP